MGKFVARSFVPGVIPNEGLLERCPDAYAYSTAWEAWEDLRNVRHEQEEKVLGINGSHWAPLFASAWGDMSALSEPDAYDEDGVFGVANIGYDWHGSKGVGVIWAPTPGANDIRDKGICYQVAYEDQYIGL